jgi:predicted Zn-dependent protease
MIRIDKLFYTLVLLVVLIGVDKLYDEVVRLLPKEKVFSHNVVAVTIPLLKTVNNKAQLAAIIGHEIAHIQLKHTVGDKHLMSMEYDSDLMSVYYMRKAGYNICEAKLFWENSGEKFLDLQPHSHPNAQTRAYYMTFPECEGYVSVKEEVTVEDAAEVFNNLNRFVAGIDRYRTDFQIIYLTNQVNAYAWTVFNDKQ